MKNSNWRGYRLAAWVGVGLLAGAIAYTLIQGEWRATLPLIGFLVVAIVFIRLEDRLPTLFDLLFVIAALLNAGGWAFKWYNTLGPYDEIAHGFTTFAITLAFGYLTYRRMLSNFHGQRLLFILTITSFGIAIGALWEIVEWVSDFFVASTVVESIDDIMDDLLMDSLGAGIAGLLSLWPLHDYSLSADQRETTSSRANRSDEGRTRVTQGA